jgi:hypothetical protein
LVFSTALLHRLTESAVEIESELAYTIFMLVMKARMNACEVHPEGSLWFLARVEQPSLALPVAASLIFPRHCFDVQHGGL